MRYWALDLLRCLNCKSFPLEIVVLESEEEEVDTTNLRFPLCKNYCGYLKKPIVSGASYPCEKCLRVNVKTAVLYCPKCNYWYPVRNGIVYMLPDKRRRAESDLEFLAKYRDRLPPEVVERGKPFNLAGQGQAPQKER
ncbi:MAG: Trm112 family protein [Desulfurococcaceae archaeon]